ncbi:unannotated protein [freshwater metagenome]|uniref:Unannotated protein n=1 Tax=freshwater metagenome TaxID=449393 RepID=A0A6J6PLK3_9ZZZZ
MVLLYRAHGEDLVSRIGIATSDDGRIFEREPHPVLEPEHDYESRGCEDPRLAHIDGTWHLTYTGYDGTSALLCLATSPDLRTWTKHGPLLPDFDTWASSHLLRLKRERRPWNKAGVIHSRRLGGTWWMWFGESAIFAATSDDLRTWTPVTDEMHPMHRPSPGRFDADLVEIGAPPVETEDGLLVFLSNAARILDAEAGTVQYSCGQFAVSVDDPATVVAATDEPWLAPSTLEDQVGLVGNVTFVQGLVQHRGEWLAYYGQADTTLAVAVAPA